MAVRLFSPRVSEGGAAPGPSSGRRVGREAAALLLVAAACYLVLALASLDLPGAAGADGSSNWMGAVGAWLARIIATGFGVVAWLVPLELLLMAAPLLRHREFRQPLGLRLSGDLLIAIIAASLVQVAFPDVWYEVTLPAGGNVGLFFGEIMRALFSTLGSFLVGVTAMALLLIARSAFSIIDAIERTLLLARRCRDSVLGWLARLRDAWREARALRRVI